MASYVYDDFAPMVDKVVDALSNKEAMNQTLAINKGLFAVRYIKILFCARSASFLSILLIMFLFDHVGNAGACEFQDLAKISEGMMSNNILSGIMALIMGIVTVIRVSKAMPRKIVSAALDYASNTCSAENMEKGRTQLPAQTVTISTTEYSAMLKRLCDLEEKVSIMSTKPVEMPAEKEEMLKTAVSRAESLEAELNATKKVLLCIF